MTSRREDRSHHSAQGEAVCSATADLPSEPAGDGALRRPYVRPAIIHELALETRAGSPLGIPDPFDPFSVGPQD